jgi:hypothetical protein
MLVNCADNRLPDALHKLEWLRHDRRRQAVASGEPVAQETFEPPPPAPEPEPAPTAPPQPVAAPVGITDKDGVVTFIVSEPLTVAIAVKAEPAIPGPVTSAPTDLITEALFGDPRKAAATLATIRPDGRAKTETKRQDCRLPGGCTLGGCVALGRCLGVRAAQSAKPLLPELSPTAAQALQDWQVRPVNTRQAGRNWFRALNEGRDAPLDFPFCEKLAAWCDQVRGVSDKAELLAALEAAA